MTDPLREATEALREFGNSGTAAASITRARVLATVRRTKSSSRRRSLLVLPLAAILVGSLAAAATGGYLPTSIQKWLLARSTPSSEKTERRDRRQSERVRVLAIASDAGRNSGEPSESTPTSQPMLDDSSRPEQQRQAVELDSGRANEAPLHVHGAPIPRAVVDDKPMSEEEYERYRLAHETHFVKKDPAAALVAWTEYLAHSPSGRLAVEARYNRALCLLKLGRGQEAKAALRPFTQGGFGAYRQKEAQRLMAQLDSDAGM